MAAPVMILPPMNSDIRAGGLPIRLLAEDAIRRARAALGKPVAAPAPAAPVEPPELPPAEEPAAAIVAVVTDAPAVPALVLAQSLRGFTVLDLYIEARRRAGEMAVEAEHLEGLAAGRTYGDRSLLPGFATPESYRIAAFEAKRRAEMAGATADFLRAMLGREATLTDLLMGGQRA